jgi:regulation of enolase protein 1 (concanavalin A-like superfamily)
MNFKFKNKVKKRLSWLLTLFLSLNLLSGTFAFALEEVNQELTIEVPVVNGSFENNLVNWWTFGQNGGQAGVIETNLAYVRSGTKSCKLVSSGSLAGAYSVVAKRPGDGNGIEFIPNTRYRVSVWVKGRNIVLPDPGRAGVNMTIEGVTAAHNKTVKAEKTGDFDWMELVLDFNSSELNPDAKAPFLARLNVTLNGWGTVWVDDLTIQRSSTPLEIATASVVKAEQTRTQADVDSAKILVDALPDSTEKTNLLQRLALIQAELDGPEEKVIDVNVSNGGFENNLSNWWTFGQNGGLNGVIETSLTNVRSGSKSCKLVSSGSLGSAYSVVAKRPIDGNGIEFLPNTRYRVSVWVKGQNVEIPSGRAGVNMSISEVPSGKTVLGNKSGDFDWTELVLDFNSDELKLGATDPFLGRINITLNGWGTVWVDDLTVQRFSNDFTPPDKVQGLSADSRGDRSVRLTWNAVVDKDPIVYYIYRSTQEGFAAEESNKIGQTGLTSYLDVSLTEGTYYYKVCAVDQSMNISEASVEVIGISFLDPSVEPKISWYPEFIEPGNHMNVEGGDFIPATTKVNLGYINNGTPGLPTTSEEITGSAIQNIRELEILQLKDYLLTVQVPKEIPENSIVGFYLQNNDKSSMIKTINAPIVEWTSYRYAQQDSNVRLIGKNLTGPEVKVYISQKDGSYKSFANVTESSKYTVNFNIPQEAPSGKYEVWVHNGLGGQLGWSAPLEINVENDPILALKSKTNTFNVTAHNISGDGVKDNTSSIQELINLVAAQGGGIVYFPNGTYIVSGMISIKPGVIIRGQSQTDTVIKDVQGTGTRQSLFYGDRDFGIENIKLLTKFSKRTIAAPAWTNHNDYFALRAVVANNMWPGINYAIDSGLRATYENLGFAQNIYVSNVCIDQSSTTSDSGRDAIAGIGISGENIEISDCDISILKGDHPIHLHGGVDIRLKNNKMTYIGHGWTRLQATRRLEVEGNSIQGNGSGSGYFFGASNLGQEQIYAARNSTSDLGSNDSGEGMCIDAMNAGTFFGTAAAYTEDTVTFLNSTWPANRLNGQYIVIMEGRGKGQVRMIRSSSIEGVAHTFKLDKPFALIPNPQSSVLIEQMVDNAIMVDNEFYRVNTSVNIWAHAHNIIVDGNYGEGKSLMNGGDLLIRGNYNTAKGTTPKPVYHITVINNTVKAGNIRFDSYAYAAKGQAGSDNRTDVLNGTNIFGGVIRGNKVYNGHQIILTVSTVTDATTVISVPHNQVGLQGVIVEENFVEDTDLGDKSAIVLANKKVWNTIVTANDTGEAFAITDNGSETIIISNDNKLPSKPVLLTPEQDSEVYKRTRFAWKNGGNAQYCNLIISKNSNMYNPVVVKTNINGMYYDTRNFGTPASQILEPDTVYYWQVESVNTVGKTVSDTGTFKTFKAEDYIRVEIEDFLREGPQFGKDLTWHDKTPGNRLDPDDTETWVDIANGQLGWTQEGEWLKYRVNVQKAGLYNIVFRYATGFHDQKMALKHEDTGRYLIPMQVIPTTGDWGKWNDLVFENIHLSSGSHTLKLELGGVINLDWYDLIYVGETTGNNPSVASFNPAPGAQNVSTFTDKIEIDFTGNMKVDTLNPQNILLDKVSGITGEPIVYTSYSAQANKYTINVESLDYFSIYRVTVTNRVLGEDNTPIQTTILRFTAEGTDIPTAPVALNVVINGNTTVYETLTGSYSYSDANGDPQGQTTFRWLRSSSIEGPYEAIPVATTVNYQLTEEDAGKFIKFEVTPVSTVEPFVGIPVVSEATAQVVARFIPEPWKGKLFGNAKGYPLYENDQFILKSSGSDVWRDNDDFLYVYQMVDSSEGEVSVTVRLDSLQNLHPDGMAGIMFRSKDTDNAANVYLRIRNGSALLTTYRLVDGGMSAFMSNPGKQAPIELKLTRKGNVFKGYYKENDEWVKVSEITVDMPTQMLVGIATCSHTTDIGEARFSNLNLEVTRPDTIAPTKPENLRVVEKSQTSLLLAWDESKDNVAVEGYEVYINNDLVQTTSENTVEIKDLSAGTSYIIIVRARDTAGNISEYSELLITRTTASVSSMFKLIDEYSESKDIDIALEQQLINSLKQAEHHYSKGSNEQALKHINDFIMHLDNKAMHKFIKDKARETLRDDAEGLIKLWNKK